MNLSVEERLQFFDFVKSYMLALCFLNFLFIIVNPQKISDMNCGFTDTRRTEGSPVQVKLCFTL